MTFPIVTHTREGILITLANGETVTPADVLDGPETPSMGGIPHPPISDESRARWAAAAAEYARDDEDAPLPF